jgi:hypothetical protein
MELIQIKMNEAHTYGGLANTTLGKRRKHVSPLLPQAGTPPPLYLRYPPCLKLAHLHPLHLSLLSTPALVTTTATMMMTYQCVNDSFLNYSFTIYLN